MKSSLTATRYLLLFAVFFVPVLAVAQQNMLAVTQQNSKFQDMSAVLLTVEKFIYTETRQLQGEVKVTLGKIDNRITLPACSKLEPFVPTGGRLRGNTSVGVRCNSLAVWTIYIQANVKIMADVVHAASPINRGQTLTTDNLTLKKVNVTQMPRAIFTSLTQVVGKVLTTNISAGQAVRQHFLRLPYVILRGQKVKLQVQGHGFIINSEGQALANVGTGQVVQVRNQYGRVISGIAQHNGVVAVQP